MSAVKRLRFGTAGVPKSAKESSTLSGIQQIARLGLDCLEIEFVMGIKMGMDTARRIKEASEKYNVGLSVHAPYFVNLNSPEQGKRLASQERLLSSARLAAVCGARSLVFHAGYYGKGTPEEAFETIKNGIREVVSILNSERTPIILRPEIMGKKSQFGSFEEILILCREIEGIQPCFDFSHIHARDGKGNSYSEFHRILKKIEKKLGQDALKNMHIHISGVEYSTQGELKHLNLKDSDFLFDDWIQALKDFGVSGMVICESPDQEQDALMLKNLYSSLLHTEGKVRES